MPVPPPETPSFPFLTSLGTSLGLISSDYIYGLDPDYLTVTSSIDTPTSVPFRMLVGSENTGNDYVYAVPNPFADSNLPTIFVGGTRPSFITKNQYEQYLQGFKYLSWPEQMNLYKVAGATGRAILANTGICPSFSNLSPRMLII